MKTRTCALVTLVISLALTAAAQAKFRVSLSLSEREPTVAQPVRAVIRAETDQESSCRMRLLAVAPGVDIYKALDALLAQPTSHVGFFAPTTRASPKTWRAIVRFPRVGRWRLVVPNWCAPGYALPPPVVLRVTVRPR